MNDTNGINALLVHGILFPVITALPLLVASLVSLVARREAGSRRTLAFRPAEMAPLGVATAMAWAAFALWFVTDAPALAAGQRGALPGIAEVAAFAVLFVGFALPLLGRIEADARRSVRTSDGDDPRRAASLTPRRLADCLPLPVSAVPWLTYAFSLALLAERVASPVPDARWFLPIGFAVAAGVFLFLYGVWLHEEALGSDPDEAASGDAIGVARRGRVRRLFAVQSVLGAVFSLLALVAVDISWQSPGGQATGALVAAVGALVGVLGCAFALSSPLHDRVLRVSARQTAS